ncbi:hypothetical protein HPB47_019794 [Ixodes persulcatus]|uniref:Uncharacterized protein n=1 Tax=Ixodes persulcatus TaxID=34615 RepID=A0AC60QH91_IXOPE|nr:hypothetical protein HPB47_019794 [Ixodes persulcatus]
MPAINFKRLYQITGAGEDADIAWRQDKSLLPRNMPCDECRQNCRLAFRSEGRPVWRCQRCGHDWKQSATTGVLFEGCRLSLGTILEVLFVSSGGGATMSSVKRVAPQVSNTLSNNTIVAWTWYFRDTCFSWIDEGLTTLRPRIGGAGKVVERKYHQGRLVPGQRILGMIELQTGTAGDRRRGGPVCLETIPNNCCNTATLIPLTQRHVVPGTTIVSDQWAVYNSLPAHQFNHLMVNNSLYFVDPQAWANTQTIESQWRAFKCHPSQGRGNLHKALGMHLCEFMRQREMNLRGTNPFLRFLEIAAAV